MENRHNNDRGKRPEAGRKKVTAASASNNKTRSQGQTHKKPGNRPQNRSAGKPHTYKHNTTHHGEPGLRYDGQRRDKMLPKKLADTREENIDFDLGSDAGEELEERKKRDEAKREQARRAHYDDADGGEEADGSDNEGRRESPGEKNKGKYTLPVLLFTFGLMAIWGLSLIGSLYNTTVVGYNEYARAASDNQWKMLSYSAERGVIYDANGNPLASNTYNFTVVCSPNTVARTTGISREEIINGFVEILGVSYEKMDSIIPTDPDDYTDERNQVQGCDIMKNVEVEVKEQLEAFVNDNDIQGIGYVAVPQRYYNYGTLAAQVIGYASNDGEALKGVYGLEASYNSVLSGTDGYRYSEVDSSNDGVLPYSEATMEDEVDGRNLVLNIDVNIQRIAEDACRNAYNTYNPRGGVCAIVMDPYTGAILAMVSMPDFDLNDPYGIPYGRTEAEWNAMTEAERIEYLMSNAWRNRCISDTYEPGSTFKALTTAIALEENLTNENEEFSDAPIEVSDVDTISCWMQKSYGYNHGTESLLTAFENSCNPIFVQLAYRIGLTKYYEYVHTFGFYETTGIDLPAEGIGIFHEDPSRIDMASLSFGESSTVTAIQLLNSYCALINGGNLMVPHVVKYITDSEGNIVDEIEPEVIRTIFSEETCARVRAMMAAVVSDGTGTAGQVPGYSVAGKTSTSTIEIGEEAGMHVLSFSCYAPSNDPKIAVLVVVNRPEDRSVGSSAPAATAARIVEATLSYMDIPRVFTEDEYDKMTIRYWVQPVAGMSAAQASSTIGRNGISTIYGSVDMAADSIVSFTYPGTDATLYSTGIVVLYPEGTTEGQMLTTTVPNLKGKTAMECIEALRDCNLNCMIDGDVTGVCTDQDIEYLREVYAGTIVTVTLSAQQQTPTPTPQAADPLAGEDGVVPTEPTEEQASGDGDDP